MSDRTNTIELEYSYREQNREHPADVTERLEIPVPVVKSLLMEFITGERAGRRASPQANWDYLKDRATRVEIERTVYQNE